MFNRTIGLNVLGKLYKVLLGLEMIMELDILKYNSQCPKLIHVLAIFFRHK